MSTIVTRAGKGSPLTNSEMDSNLTNLNTDKVEGQISSVDNEIALFSGTGGKTIKRASTTGVLKASSGVISAATAGTDYSAGTSALATGILKSTTTTGTLSIATAGTDYAAPGTSSTWTTTQTYNNSVVRILGSSTGYHTVTSSNAGASNYTLYIPASTTYIPASSQQLTFSGPTASRTYTLPDSASTLAALGTAQTWTATQTYNASTIRILGSSTGYHTVTSSNAGASNYTLYVPAATTYIPSSSQQLTFSGPTAARTLTLPDESFSVGYRNIPAVGTKTTSYTLAVGDVGKYVQLGSGGAITIPDATFAEGDVISLVNNTSGNITITCTITTAYIAGTDSDKATVTLATRGQATIFFLSSTVCVISGNVS